MLLKIIISMLLAKNERNAKRYNPKLNNENRYLITFYNSESEDCWYIGGINGNEVKYDCVNGWTKHSTELKSINRFRITHCYKGIDAIYENIYWAGFLSFSGISTYRLKQKTRILNKVSNTYRKERLLQSLISLKDLSHNVSKETLYRELMGAYKGSGENRYKHEINWQLDALQNCDLIKINHKSIDIKPEALNELSNFELAERRHRDSRALTKAQIFLGFCMLIITIYNVLFK
ncbi:MAG: hypothetical protein ACRDC6_16235 [Shewanella sp.]